MTLAAELIARIKTHGPLTVAAYMARCNAHYYGTRDPFGVTGDFITAPEISQIFGELIGAWMASEWEQTGNSKSVLCEAGPGRGTLMKDALRATRPIDGFHEALEVRLIDTSEALCAIQLKTLKDSHPRITAHATLDRLPSLPLFLIANEFFDALPIEQYAGDHERKVGHDGTAFFFLPEGEVTRETSSASLAAMDKIAAHIKNFGGAALVIDYGYAGNESGDTLQAVRGHEYVNPLKDPGESDMTAHVDFISLAEAARRHGVQVHGPVPQGLFLKRLGAELRATALCRNASPKQQLAILSGLERIVAPHQMGELFKVMAITSAMEAPAGF